MLALRVTDLKTFTNEMFIGELFDNFLCVKAAVNHNINYTVDGHINNGFLDANATDDYISWKKLKPLIFSMIKGNKLPIGFNIVLAVTKESLNILYNSSTHDYTIEQVEGLFVNVIFKNGEIMITTGTSYSIFSMDKGLDNSFENAVKKLLISKNIDFEE